MEGVHHYTDTTHLTYRSYQDEPYTSSYPTTGRYSTTNTTNQPPASPPRAVSPPVAVLNPPNALRSPSPLGSSSHILREMDERRLSRSQLHLTQERERSRDGRRRSEERERHARERLSHERFEAERVVQEERHLLLQRSMQDKLPPPQQQSHDGGAIYEVEISRGAPGPGGLRSMTPPATSGRPMPPPPSPPGRRAESVLSSEYHRPTELEYRAREWEEAHLPSSPIHRRSPPPLGGYRGSNSPPRYTDRAPTGPSSTFASRRESHYAGWPSHLSNSALLQERISLYRHRDPRDVAHFSHTRSAVSAAGGGGGGSMASRPASPPCAPSRPAPLPTPLSPGSGTLPQAMASPLAMGHPSSLSRPYRSSSLPAGGLRHPGTPPTHHHRAPPPPGSTHTSTNLQRTPPLPSPNRPSLPLSLDTHPPLPPAPSADSTPLAPLLGTPLVTPTSGGEEVHEMHHRTAYRSSHLNRHIIPPSAPSPPSRLPPSPHDHTTRREYDILGRDIRSSVISPRREPLQTHEATTDNIVVIADTTSRDGATSPTPGSQDVAAEIRRYIYGGSDAPRRTPTRDRGVAGQGVGEDTPPRIQPPARDVALLEKAKELSRSASDLQRVRLNSWAQGRSGPTLTMLQIEREMLQRRLAEIDALEREGRSHEPPPPPPSSSSSQHVKEYEMILPSSPASPLREPPTPAALPASTAPLHQPSSVQEEVVQRTRLEWVRQQDLEGRDATAALRAAQRERERAAALTLRAAADAVAAERERLRSREIDVLRCQEHERDREALAQLSTGQRSPIPP